MIQSIDYNKCSRCGRCVQICPMDVFQALGSLVYIAHQKDCMTCYLCEEECCSGAIYVDPSRGYKVIHSIY